MFSLIIRYNPIPSYNCFRLMNLCSMCVCVCVRSSVFESLEQWFEPFEDVILEKKVHQKNFQQLNYLTDET